MQDPTSPDGKRVILRGEAWQAERFALYQAAAVLGLTICEGCEYAHALALSQGDPHHLYGKGAGKRDDRLWIQLSDGTRRRNLLWVCRLAHDYIHSVGIRKWREEHAELLKVLALRTQR